MLRNDLVRRRYVEKTGTVQYGPHGRVNLADIWRRADLPRDGKAPVLLQVPGGAWSIGMRRPQAYPLLSHLADHGWICVSIDYRVSPRNTWPDHIVDVKRALAWIKEHIAEYGGDPDFVAITGGSAGGHLSALAALTADDPQFQPGFEDADTSVVAAVPIYGRYDWVSTQGNGRREFLGYPAEVRRQEADSDQPAGVRRRLADHRLRADAPPFFILHGQDDSIIPVPEGREFAEALREVSTSPVVYAEIPHAQHAFDFYYGSPRAHYTAQAVEKFLSWVQAMRTAEAHWPARAHECTECGFTNSSQIDLGATRAAGSIRPVRPSRSRRPSAPREACGDADLDERLDHGVGQLVRILERPTVREHRDVELVDVAPDRDVEPAARRQRTDRVDLGHQCAADPGASRGGRARWRSAGSSPCSGRPCSTATGTSPRRGRREVRRPSAHQFGPDQRVALLAVAAASWAARTRSRGSSTSTGRLTSTPVK